jgi:hypothetical protein
MIALRAPHKSLLLAAILIGATEGPARPQDKGPAPDTMAAEVAIPAEAVKWREMSAKAPGVLIAELWGDSRSGPWGGLVRFPAGSRSSVHIHSAGARILVMSGTWRYGATPDTERTYGPGSYVLIPAGHPHSNSQPEAVTLFMEQAAAFDNKPAGAGPAR